jgi:hypothetical protein
VRERRAQREGEEHAAPAPQLARLAFLVGRLRGEGWLGERDYHYTKQVVGAWAAGGHHLVVDMMAEYPLRNGSCDRHATLLVVSAGAEPGSLIGHAFTDGGGTIDYELRSTSEGLEFDDRPPHGCAAERARKRLRATPGGYEETLEIDRGDGAFAPFAQIRLEREAS